MGCAVLSDIGRKREANEDFCSAVDELRLYVVADGLGGHAAGRVAAEAGTLQLVHQISAWPGEPGLEPLRVAVRAGNTLIRQLAGSDRRLRGMGTTLVALWLGPYRAFMAHVGDSRIYLIRDRRIRQLTVDHSLVRELVWRRELAPEDAREHPSRNVITRALGVRASLEPDLASLRLEPEDRFVLCTDGLTGHVRDEEIASVVLDCGDDLPQAVEVLVELANTRGGEDNTTVILVDRPRPARAGG